MQTVRITVLSLFLVAGMVAQDLSAQDLHPSRRPSPLGMARGFTGNTYVKITFSQPYKRGRDNVFGRPGSDVMHPYGELWRFGANEPTEITFTGPVMFGDKRIEAGTYSIFATPGADSWTLHVNDMRGGGANEYDAERNVAEVMTSVSAPDEEVDQFSIILEEESEGLKMVTSWLNWEFSVPIVAAQ